MIKSTYQINVACKYRLKWGHKHIDSPPKNLEQLVKSVIDSNIIDIIAEIKLPYKIINLSKLPIPLYKYILPKSTAK